VSAPYTRGDEVQVWVSGRWVNGIVTRVPVSGHPEVRYPTPSSDAVEEIDSFAPSEVKNR
jgi:hypothetical protein